GARAPRPRSAPTSITRAAGLALTKVLAGEGAPYNVLVNALLVGFIEADQHVRAAEKAGIPLEDYVSVRAKEIPLGRIGRAEEFANIACFLASDAASYITGTAINVDGGRSPVGDRAKGQVPQKLSRANAENRSDRASQLILRSSALMIGDQRARSASILARNCAGVVGIGSMNCVASFSRISGWPRAATTVS